MEILEIEITELMREKAREDEQLIIEDKGGVYNNVSDESDFLGSLGEQVVEEYFKECGFSPTVFPYFVSGLKRDPFDIEWRESKIDVKTSPSDREVTDRSIFLIPNYIREKEEKVDKYVFVKINEDKTIGYIAGIIDYDKFWSLEQTPETRPLFLKTPAHFALGYQLDSFRRFVYGV